MKDSEDLVLLFYIHKVQKAKGSISMRSSFVKRKVF